MSLRESYTYQVFGLTLQSDILLPELRPSKHSQASVDVVIQQGSVDKPPEALDRDKPPLFLAIASVGQFLIDQHTICYERAPSLENTNPLRLYLLGSCLGILLLQRGHVVLHGNAIIDKQGHCRIYVGDSGAGKSTLAAWCVLQGHQLLTDDVAVIRFDGAGKPWVYPGYPQIKLWEEALNLLGIEKTGLRRLREEHPKYAWPIPHAFYEEAYPLREVIELTPHKTSAQVVTGVHKINQLLHHSYRASFLTRLQLVQDYVKQLAHLATQVELTAIPRPQLVCS